VTRISRILLIIGPTLAVAALCAFVVLRPAPAAHHQPRATGASCGKPIHPTKYVGLITHSHPGGKELASFARAAGYHPDLVAYFVPFRAPWDRTPACRILRDGALPLIQIDPGHVSLAAIAAGTYDRHLKQYARQVRRFGRHIAIGFGHEMNGTWYRWGYHHVPATVFVAAWRHIVTVFRKQGANNVTWVWTVNIISKATDIPSPRPWWPGSSYVNWVGIDGYYYKPTWEFASLFGPTISVVRSFTLKPIIISETAVASTADQPAKIPNLFAGVQKYGLLGFVWYDAHKIKNWAIDTPAAFAAFTKGAQAFTGPSL
jgi:mannan endo-1,4-beta-mannosidase